MQYKYLKGVSCTVYLKGTSCAVGISEGCQLCSISDLVSAVQLTHLIVVSCSAFLKGVSCGVLYLQVVCRLGCISEFLRFGGCQPKVYD